MRVITIPDDEDCVRRGFSRSYLVDVGTKICELQPRAT